jgi:hypothetical protein
MVIDRIVPCCLILEFKSVQRRLMSQEKGTKCIGGVAALSVDLGITRG